MCRIHIKLASTDMPRARVDPQHTHSKTSSVTIPSPRAKTVFSSCTPSKLPTFQQPWAEVIPMSDKIKGIYRFIIGLPETQDAFPSGFLNRPHFPLIAALLPVVRWGRGVPALGSSQQQTHPSVQTRTAGAPASSWEHLRVLPSQDSRWHHHDDPGPLQFTE